MYIWEYITLLLQVIQLQICTISNQESDAITVLGKYCICWDVKLSKF